MPLDVTRRLVFSPSDLLEPRTPTRACRSCRSCRLHPRQFELAWHRSPLQDFISRTPPPGTQAKIITSTRNAGELTGHDGGGHATQLAGPQRPRQHGRLGRRAPVHRFMLKVRDERAIEGGGGSSTPAGLLNHFSRRLSRQSACPRGRRAGCRLQVSGDQAHLIRASPASTCRSS